MTDVEMKVYCERVFADVGNYKYFSAYGSTVKLYMYCRSAPARCAVSNPSHSRGEHLVSAMKSVAR